MKKYFIVFALVALSPSVAFASWWNPLSWFGLQITPTNQLASSTLVVPPMMIATTTATTSVSLITSTSTPTTTVSKPKKKVLPSVIIPVESFAISTTTVSQQGVTPQEFVEDMDTLRVNIETSNPLIDEKNAVLNAAMGNLIDQKTLVTLPPNVQQMIQSGNRDVLLLMAQSLNNSIQEADFETDQLFQTKINNYLIANGLPITTPVPTKTTCNGQSYQTFSNSNNSASNNGTVDCYTQ